MTIRGALIVKLDALQIAPTAADVNSLVERRPMLYRLWGMAAPDVQQLLVRVELRKLVPARFLVSRVPVTVF